MPGGHQVQDQIFPVGFHFGANLDASVNTDNATSFIRTVKLTSTTIGTAVPIIDDSQVPSGFYAFPVWFRLVVNGATAWTTLTSLAIEDTAGNDFITIAAAALTGNAIIGPGTANVTLQNRFIRNTGGAISKGIQAKANANAGAGSDAYLVIAGYYAPAQDV